MGPERLASDDPSQEATQPPSRPDCWVFDVDGCLVDSLTGSSLRPGTSALLAHLVREHALVLLWSAGGAGYARARAEQFGVDDLVDGYFDKEGRDPEGCYLTAHLPLQGHRAVFVDDRPEDLASDLDILAVSPYLSADEHDCGLQSAARRAGLA